MAKQVTLCCEDYSTKKKLAYLIIIKQGREEWHVHVPNNLGGFHLKKAALEGDSIVMNRQDVERLIKNLREKIKQKPIEISKIGLTFQKNKPGLIMRLRYVSPSMWPPEKRGEYGLECFVKQLTTRIYYPALTQDVDQHEYCGGYEAIALKDGFPIRTEDADYYDDSSVYIGAVSYFDQSTLESFLEELEDALVDQ